MFEGGGCAYVYMIYGFYFCLNAVTEPEDYPAAVLIRAIEPLDHVPVMKKLRQNPDHNTNIGRRLDVGRIIATPRIGVDYAGEYKDKPWRFCVDGNPHVSRVKFR